ncbi:hypothetical protein E2C01_010709 [Portunus trituberculatus]|uniref:Uncharacterized protein n=1 Tax=Portunus trituberculatus TaxID=210409 RepID=A0A5B7D9D2_PORTR|nr:hypothetical protein [Portunus trituberculatus]
MNPPLALSDEIHFPLGWFEGGGCIPPRVGEVRAPPRSPHARSRLVPTRPALQPPWIPTTLPSRNTDCTDIRCVSVTNSVGSSERQEGDKRWAEWTVLCLTEVSG